MKTIELLTASAIAGIYLTTLGMFIYDSTLFFYGDLGQVIAAGFKNWFLWTVVMATGFMTVLRPYYELWKQRMEDNDTSGGGAL